MFQIKVDDKGVVTLLGQIQKRVSDMTPVMRGLGELIKTSVKRNFEVGGRYSEEGNWRGGTRAWLPLSLATLFTGKKGKYVTKTGKYKKGVEDKFKGRHTLIKTGRLYHTNACPQATAGMGKRELHELTKEMREKQEDYEDDRP